MSVTLAVAAFLTFAIGLAHTVLGEKFIIAPVLRRADLPKLYGSELFTKRLIRYAWHLTTLLMWSLAAILVYQTKGPQEVTILEIISATFVIAGIADAIVTRGKHFAWPVFIVIGLLVWFFGGFD